MMVYHLYIWGRNGRRPSS